MAILITGAAGFVGSHTAVELINCKEEVVLIDNFSNSSSTVIKNIEKIVKTKIVFYEANCCCEKELIKIFNSHKIKEVVHFAGLKAVGESVKQPLVYYYENLTSSLTLLKVMQKFGCEKIVFSSSATVYGDENVAPFDETMPTKAINPYGETKIFIEKILHDYCVANSNFSAVCLRYFNPIGAHKSGLIGDLPKTKIPNNLMPYIAKVATGEFKCLKIFGKNHKTFDGTCIRDYIHIVDLSKGHFNAVNFCRNNKGFEIFNLGTGKGHSVLEVVKVFEQVNNVKIAIEFVNARPGDIAVSFCSSKKAKNGLNWEAKLNLNQMCVDAFNFEKNVKNQLL